MLNLPMAMFNRLWENSLMLLEILQILTLYSTVNEKSFSTEIISLHIQPTMVFPQQETISQPRLSLFSGQ